MKKKDTGRNKTHREYRRDNTERARISLLVSTKAAKKAKRIFTNVSAAVEEWILSQ